MSHVSWRTCGEIVPEWTSRNVMLPKVSTKDSLVKSDERAMDSMVDERV